MSWHLPQTNAHRVAAAIQRLEALQSDASRVAYAIEAHIEARREPPTQRELQLATGLINMRVNAAVKLLIEVKGVTVSYRSHAKSNRITGLCDGGANHACTLVHLSMDARVAMARENPDDPLVTIGKRVPRWRVADAFYFKLAEGRAHHLCVRYCRTGATASILLQAPPKNLRFRHPATTLTQTQMRDIRDVAVGGGFDLAVPYECAHAREMVDSTGAHLGVKKEDE